MMLNILLGNLAMFVRLLACVLALPGWRWLESQTAIYKKKSAAKRQTVELILLGKSLM